MLVMAIRPRLCLLYVIDVACPCTNGRRRKIVVFVRNADVISLARKGGRREWRLISRIGKFVMRLVVSITVAYSKILFLSWHIV
jgi:hypothetical protein